MNKKQKYCRNQQMWKEPKSISRNKNIIEFKKKINGWVNLLDITEGGEKSVKWNTEPNYAEGTTVLNRD